MRLLSLLFNFNSCGVGTTEKWTCILQLEEFGIQIFWAKIQIFFDCIALLCLEEHVSHLNERFGRIELDDPDDCSSKAVFFRRTSKLFVEKQWNVRSRWGNLIQARAKCPTIPGLEKLRVSIHTIHSKHPFFRKAPRHVLEKHDVLPGWHICVERRLCGLVNF